MLDYDENDPIRQVKVAVRDPNALKISILKKEHIAGASEIFTRSFCDGEPLTKFLGVSYDEFRPLATKVATKAAADKLSVVAIDKSGRVVGCVIAEDTHDPIKMSEFGFMKPIYKFLETLSKPFTEMQFKQGSVIHIWVTAVADDVKGTGLSTMLNNACVSLALQNGFSYVFAEFTSEINEKHMNRFPDNMRSDMRFKDFVLNGEKPFSSLEGTACSYICSAAPYISLKDIEDCLLRPNTIVNLKLK